MKDIPLSDPSKIARELLKSSRMRQPYNLFVMAIEEVDQEKTFNPSFASHINAGDTLLETGEKRHQLALGRELNAESE
jgi:K+/H+ antiporter YhaU regulatory subunit KhtT